MKLSTDKGVLEGAVGDRVGICLAFAKSADYFFDRKFLPFGVRKTYWLKRESDIGDDSARRYDGKDMARLAISIADGLVSIADEHRGHELVVVAFMPKAVALAVGWHIAQRECSFFRGTHPMNFIPDAETFVPMRVRLSQPTTPPQSITILGET